MHQNHQEIHDVSTIVLLELSSVAGPAEVIWRDATRARISHLKAAKLVVANLAEVNVWDVSRLELLDGLSVVELDAPVLLGASWVVAGTHDQAACTQKRQASAAKCVKARLAELSTHHRTLAHHALSLATVQC